MICDDKVFTINETGLIFNIVNFLLNGDVVRCTSYNVYVSLLICFVRVSSQHVDDSNIRNKALQESSLKKIRDIINFEKVTRKFSIPDLIQSHV